MRALLAAALLLAVSAPLHAQTNDHFFRSWRWPQESAAARAAGWAGQDVAALDEAESAASNPALLTSLTKLDGFATLSLRGSGSAPLGDAVGRATSLGACGLAGRLSNRWGLGLFAFQPRAARLDVLPLRLSDGSVDSGSLDLRATDLVLAGAFRPTARLHLGAQLVRSSLELSGDYRHELSSGQVDIRVRSAGQAASVTGGFGVLYEASSRVALGFGTQRGLRYEFQRSAESPVLGVVLEERGAYQVVRPSRLQAGARLRLSPRLVLGAQLDFVRYSEVPAALVIGQGARSRDEYRLNDAFEPRLGAEFSIPLRGFSLQMRAGLQGQAGGTLRFLGDEPAEVSAFPGSRYELLGALGLSLVSGRGLRLDLAGAFGGERPALLVGAGARF